MHKHTIYLRGNALYLNYTKNNKRQRVSLNKLTKSLNLDNTQALEYLEGLSLEKILKPQKEASNAHDSEAQSISTYFPAFTLIKDQNKHENIRVSENFSTQEFEEKNQACTNTQDLKNLDSDFAFKSSKISNPSLFNRFSAFFSSILGNLDTKHLNQYERSAFEEFLNYRSEKHKLSYSTKKALLHQCEALKAQGCDLVACINQSIRRNYNEIYEVMHFEKPSHSYKSEAEQRNQEIMEQFDYDYKPNPKYNGLCIW